MVAIGLTHGHQRLDLISDLASHYSGRPSLERVAKTQNRDRHTLGDALVVLNPLMICLRYWGHLEATSQKTTQYKYVMCMTKRSRPLVPYMREYRRNTASATVSKRVASAEADASAPCFTAASIEAGLSPDPLAAMLSVDEVAFSA